MDKIIRIDLIYNLFISTMARFRTHVA